ncbi:MAG: hypothetical protein KDA89_21680 [Planctomycetaceae bacterium]|nr:hypothetical protein [Planctomycetaceae bacterium]
MPNQPPTDPFANNDQPNFIQPQMNNAVANVGDAGFSGSGAPNMIGDFFGTFSVPYSPVGGGSFPLSSPHFTGNLASAPGGNVGRLKLTENASLIPTNRYFVNYSYFNDINGNDGFDVNRVTPGFETTFLNDNMSLEFRFPFADTVSSTQTAARASYSQGEFGNMSVWWKALLARNSQYAVSTGLGLTLPTADDYLITDGGTALTVDNQSVHLLPFIGVQVRPDDRWFAQGMLQLDIDANGNPVAFGALGTPYAGAGRPNDNTYLFVDMSVGYWVYKSGARDSAVQGIAPIVEIHHNTTLDNGQGLNQNGFTQAAPGGTSVTNVVVGVTTQMNGNKWITLGYTTPIGNDRQFDGELRLLLNWTPGGTGNTFLR